MNQRPFFFKFLIAIWLCAKASALSAPGDLDPTFGGTGKVTTSVGVGDDEIPPNGLVIQSDRKIVAVGKTFNGSDYDVAIVRYKSDGSPDTTFGPDHNGIVKRSIGPGDDFPLAVTLDSMERIVVTGYFVNGSHEEIFLQRFLANGDPDPDFNGGQAVSTTYGSYGNARAQSILVQPDHKILVGGYYATYSNYTTTDFLLVRFNENGSTDSLFNGDGNNDGKIGLHLGKTNKIVALALQAADQKIFAAGYSGQYESQSEEHNFVLRRLNPDGSYDADFNGNNFVSTDFGGFGDFGVGAAIQPVDQKIIVAGFSYNGNNYDFALARYVSVGGLNLPSGGLDPDFDSDGLVTTQVDFNDDKAYGVVLQADGKIVVAGYTYLGGRNIFAVVRYNGNGSIDSGFGTNGRVKTPIGSGSDVGQAVGVDPDGKIVVAGYSYNGTNNDFAVVRYLGTDGPQHPVVETQDASDVTTVEAKLKGRAIPQGQATTGWFEYGTAVKGTDGTYQPDLPTFKPITPRKNLGSGTTFADFDKVISGLSATKRYYYRAVADNGIGNPVKGQIKPFHHPPTVTTLQEDHRTTDPSSGRTGVRLNGLVNPVGSSTEYYFEYGLDEGAATHYLPTQKKTESDYKDHPANADVTGLLPASVYRFRLVAKSQIVSTDPAPADRTFIAPALPPTVVTGAPTQSTGTSAQFNGTVNPNGKSTIYYFQYRSGNPLPANWTLTDEQGPISGYEPIVVASKKVDNLLPKKPYEVQLLAKVGGTIYPGDVVSRTAGAPDLVTPGLLGVGRYTLKLVGKDGFTFRYRLQGQLNWTNSGGGTGAGIAGLLAGEYFVEFEQQPAHPITPSRTVNVGVGSDTQEVAAPRGAAGADGTLTVSIEYETEPTNTAQQGKWRFSGEGEAQWRDGGLAALPLVPGLYIIEFKSASGKARISNRSIRIVSGQATVVRAYYEMLTANPPGAPPALVSASDQLGKSPHAYCGQLQSDLGLGSGTVVQPRVVLTAAHVIFDDVTLSYATGLEWRFQRRSGEIEPPPMSPRGSYLFKGYAAERQKDVEDHGVGHATQKSQQQDVAAVFFRRDAGRGGYIAVLKSDETNDWLHLSPDRQSMLFGYPTDLRILGTEANSGKLYATAAPQAGFSLVGAEPGAERSWVYASNKIAGYPGMSGGALCIKYDDGQFYPAAVYLGGDDRAVVRAIDDKAMDLIEQADLSSDDDSNHTDGGTVIVESRTLKGDESPAHVTVKITHPDGKWIPSRQGKHPGGEVPGARLEFTAGSLTISFTKVKGYVVPGDFILKDLKAHEEVVLEANYAKAEAPQIETISLPDGIEGKVYAKVPIKASNAPTSISVGETLPAGMKLKDRAIGGMPQYEGTYMVEITASNTIGTTSRRVPLVIRKAGTLLVKLNPADGERGGVGDLTSGSAVPLGVGSIVKLKATAKPGFIFSRWTGVGLPNLPSGDPRLSFEMPQFAEVTAEFIENPFPTLAGKYRGPLLLTDSPTKLQDFGLAQFAVTTSGAYSGTITIEGVAYPVKGKFASDRTAATQIKTTAGLAPPSLKLALDDSHDLAGTLTFTVPNGAARILNFTARPSLEAGILPAAKYTLELLKDPRHAAAIYPQGTSVATISLAKSGSIKAKLILADGTKAIASGYVTKPPAGKGTAQWTLFSNLYKRQGVLVGDILFGAPNAPAGSNLSGTVSWVRNAMTTTRFKAGWPDRLACPAKGYLYVPPRAAKGADQGKAILNGMELTDSDAKVKVTFSAPTGFFNEDIKLTPLGKLTVTSAGEQKLQLLLTPATGLFTGSFTDPDDKKLRTIAGVLEQPKDMGAGFYLTPTDSDLELSESAAVSLVVP